VDRPVRVRATDRVDVPALVGWRWPVILVPAGDPPDAESMDAVLAHEIAHVRRHDYLANLLQTVADALLFYSPAAWWISAQIREERECACDVTAVRAIDGGLARYVRTLLSLETRRAPLAGAAALNGGSLVRRVRRLHRRERDGRAIDWPRAAALVLVAATLGSAAPERADPVPLAARVGATSLMLQDLDGMRVVVQAVHFPVPGPTLQPEDCPAPKHTRA
jgi:beta-lactamase regulating signal transducer with metallopeptidase domain